MNSELKQTKQILVPSKNPDRFFGINFFASLYEGSYPYYRYFASLMDYDQTFSTEEISPKPGGLKVFEEEIAKIERGSVIGFYQNPDPYNELEEQMGMMREVLTLIKKYHLGVWIETTSSSVERDFDLLKEISANASVVVSIPISHQNDHLIKLFEGEHSSKYGDRIRLIHKAKHAGLSVGVLLKPMIPYINDSSEMWQVFIEALSSENVDFIYPNFVLSLTEQQRLAFLQLIYLHFPGLKNIYMDKYGSKKTWASQNQQSLKKDFVFACKKHKIKFGMKEIVEMIHPKNVEQFRLF